LGGLTLALGVTGAGIAFALQVVVASVAGWLAVSFGGFYKVGDRIQLGGIKLCDELRTRPVEVP
jgi:small-conductance mechanosensitive channel